MKVGKLKKLLAKCEDEAVIFVAHGGSHELPIAALIGSIDREENLRHGYGILVGNDDVLKSYIQRMDQLIQKDPLLSAAWRRRRDFWLDEMKTLEAIDAVIVEEKPVEEVVVKRTERVKLRLNAKNRKKDVEES